jgi:hypothetical protein
VPLSNSGCHRGKYRLEMVVCLTSRVRAGAMLQHIILPYGQCVAAEFPKGREISEHISI